VCIQVAEIGASVFQNLDMPNIGRSDNQSAEVPVSAFQIPEMPIFGVSDL